MYYVQWDSKEDKGSAWVQSKAQLDQIVAILKSKPGTTAKVETHIVPRDKGGLVGWLNQQAEGRAKPSSTMTITMGE